MPEVETIGVVFLACSVLMAPFIAWAAWQMLPERVRVVEGYIVKAERGRRESMSLAEIECIRFHYHAVVGFGSSWEFLSKDGSAMNVNGEAKGVEQIISTFEDHLPGFSLVEFKRRFDAGDVEDTIDVWKRLA